jgi:hypothetical protein
MKIQTILILVELDNGHVHQVLASKEQKEICVALLRSEEGALRLSERVEPITLEFHSANAGGMARELAAQDSESPTNVNG